MLDPFFSRSWAAGVVTVTIPQSLLVRADEVIQ